MLSHFCRRICRANNYFVWRQFYSKKPTEATSSSGRVAAKKTGPTWGRKLIFGLGALATTVPLCYLSYRCYRVYSVGGRPYYDPTISLTSQLVVNPRIIYKDVAVPYLFLTRIIELETFQVRPDDIFVAGFPRSGTTWTQELVYMIANDADTVKATSDVSDKRIPLLELFFNALKSYNTRDSPRFFKTHLPYHLLPSEVETIRPKIIYIARNPKDVSVSYFHLLKKTITPVKDDFDLFVDRFLDNKLMWCPWPEHVKEFWERKDQENILFIKYEDMIKDIDGAVRKIASFLGKTLTEEQIATVIQHCSFDSMRNNDKANFQWFKDSVLTKNIADSYMRKGKVGDWKNYHTDDQSTQMETLVDETLKGIGLTFEYEITSD